MSTNPNQPQANTNGFTGRDLVLLCWIQGKLSTFRFRMYRCEYSIKYLPCGLFFDSAPDDGTLDDDGHGSNVSAIVSKVATKTKIIGIDVFRKVRSQGKWVSTAYDSDILAGLTGL